MGGSMRRYLFGCFLMLIILSFAFIPDQSLSGVTAPLCFYKSFDAGEYPFSICGIDVDDDGLTDLIIGNLTQEDNLRIFKNTGNGNFELMQIYSIQNSSPIAVCAAEINDDSRDDLIVATGTDSVALLIHQDGGTDPFSQTTFYESGQGCVSVCASDFDLDGDQDLAISGARNSDVTFLFNNGGAREGLFGSLQIYSLHGVVTKPAQVFGADMNGDSYPDLIVGNSQDQNIAIMMNKGGEIPDSAGKFYHPISINLNGAQPTSLWAGLLNDDPFNDIVVSFYGSNSMCVLFNNPQNPGNFHTSAQFPLGYVPQFILGVDLNNDNGNDIIALNEGYPPAPGNLYAFFNDGQGNFSQHNRIFLTEPTEYDPFAIGMFSADLDGDEDMDVAVVNFSAGKISILLNSEEIRGDVNNSGYIDVIDAVYLLNYIFRKGPEPYTQESGDLNSDGNLSISDVIFILKYIFQSKSPTPGCLCEQ
jgi:hypothetical protein